MWAAASCDVWCEMWEWRSNPSRKRSSNNLRDYWLVALPANVVSGDPSLTKSNANEVHEYSKQAMSIVAANQSPTIDTPQGVPGVAPLVMYSNASSDHSFGNQSSQPQTQSYSFAGQPEANKTASTSGIHFICRGCSLRNVIETTTKPINDLCLSEPNGCFTTDDVSDGCVWLQTHGGIPARASCFVAMPCAGAM